MCLSERAAEAEGSKISSGVKIPAYMLFQGKTVHPGKKSDQCKCGGNSRLVGGTRKEGAVASLWFRASAMSDTMIFHLWQRFLYAGTGQLNDIIM